MTLIEAERVLHEDLEALRQAHARMLATLEGLSEADVRAPSRLPGWTRGHLLAHLARNADACRNLATWARTGEETPMYASRGVRDADIDSGATRAVPVLVEDLAFASRVLEPRLAELAELGGEALEREVRTASASFPGRDLAYSRMREVEIHLVDLDLGYSRERWPGGFVVRTLDDLAPLFLTGRDSPVSVLEGSGTGRSWHVGRAGPVLRGAEHDLLAWLTGRGDGRELGVEPDGPVPAAPRWA